MKKAFYFIYTLLLYSKIVAPVKKDSDSKSERSPVNNREESTRPKATNKTMLADLIKNALFQENKGKFLTAADGQIALKQLLQMDDDDCDAIKEDEIVDALEKMRDDELMICQVFKLQQQNENLIKSSILSKKQQAAFGKELEKLYETKKTDPALTQIIEILLVHIEDLKAGGIKQEIKEYFKYAIIFFAKRQHISKEELENKKKDGKKLKIGTLFKIIIQKKNKYKEKTILEYLYNLIDNFDVTENLGNGTNIKKKQKGRRRKKRTGITVPLSIVFGVIALVLLTLLVLYVEKKSKQKSQQSAPSNGITTDADDCTICQDGFKENDAFRSFYCNPQAKHTFHTACINQWFLQQKTCPTCRRDLSNTQDINETTDGSISEAVVQNGDDIV